MGGAVAVTFVAFRPIIRRKRLSFDKTAIDAPLIAGAVIFGPGWGIGAYCPGPAVTALSSLTLEVFVFVAAMIVGGLFARMLPSSRSGA
jgi:hypothetical protein